MTEQTNLEPDYFWLPPDPGDIVWCRLPSGMGAARPALVIQVDKNEDGVSVHIAPGTSHAKGGALLTQDNRHAFLLSGLSYATEFQAATLVLAWNDQNFGCVSPDEHPRLGLLHPTLVLSFAQALKPLRGSKPC